MWLSFMDWSIIHFALFKAEAMLYYYDCMYMWNLKKWNFQIRYKKVPLHMFNLVTSPTKQNNQKWENK